MIRYYLKFAARNILRQKIYSFINILGLAIGLSLFLIIGLYVKNEYSYDKHNEKYENIYRMEFGDWCVIPPGFAHILNGQIPEIDKITRTSFIRNVLCSYEDISSKQPHRVNLQSFMGVDSTFFEMFDVEFISGSADHALKEPLTIVLNETTAKILFGDEDPLNKVIKLNNEVDFRVDGVIKDLKNSHLISNAFYSVSSNDITRREGATKDLSSSNYLTYFLFNDGFNVNTVRTKIFNFFAEYKESDILDDDDTEDFIILRPLSEIYFFKEAQFESGVKHGNKPVVKAFTIIAIFILLIACINFINLTTARASIRAKEVGIKKVVGSSRASLISHFLIESIMISSFAMLIAITFLQILLPEFNNIALTNLSIDSITSTNGLIFVISLSLILGLISGLYPAFYLSYFRPISALKGETSRGNAAGIFRKVLISFQFIIASILISGTLVVNQQIKFLKNKDLGFEKEHVLNFRLQIENLGSHKQFKAKLLQIPNIAQVSFSHGIPGLTRNTNTFTWKDEPITSRVTSVDANYFELYEIEFIDGNADTWEFDSDQRKSAVINETLAKRIGWENPVGKVINRNFRPGHFMNSSFKIVGVFKDFHLESLHTPVVPLAICRDDRTHYQASLKVSGEQIPETLSKIEKVWNEFSPNFPFKYSFLDQQFDQMYKSEERMQKIAIYFSILSIFIACLGLFGLSAFMTQRRFKEIGIRKVLGSSISQIVIKLSHEFSILVIISNIIAIPISWYVLTKWLEDYPYHDSVQWWVFPIAVLFTLIVALMTTSFHAMKAAIKNPVEAIRHE
jgi:putative ABC transport system permease protein